MRWKGQKGSSNVDDRRGGGGGTGRRVGKKQMGLGGDDSWSLNALPHKEFRIPSKNKTST